MMNDVRIILIGYGNPGRLDDGLGPALAAAVEAMRLPGMTAESKYHLTVEDAESVARHDIVIFADAAVSGPEPFELRSIEPAVTHRFTTHGIDPETVLGLARDVFGAETRGFVLAIRGYEFNDFGETLSDGARRNLADAVRAIRRPHGRIADLLDREGRPDLRVAPAQGD